MDNLWIIYGSYMVYICLYMVNLWIIYGLSMDMVDVPSDRVMDVNKHSYLQKIIHVIIDDDFSQVQFYIDTLR